MSKKGKTDLVRNPKAYHDYEITETLEAGIALKGTEIKSLRGHQGSLKEAYVKFIRGELWLVGCHIPPYSYGNVHNHEEYRDRKLLLHKRELKFLREQTREKGMAIVALAIYLGHGKAKLRIGVGRGKKMHDKRHALKDREAERRMRSALKKDSI